MERIKVGKERNICDEFIFILQCDPWFIPSIRWIYKYNSQTTHNFDPTHWEKEDGLCTSARSVCTSHQSWWDLGGFVDSQNKIHLEWITVWSPVFNSISKKRIQNQLFVKVSSYLEFYLRQFSESNFLRFVQDFIGNLI